MKVCAERQCISMVSYDTFPTFSLLKRNCDPLLSMSPEQHLLPRNPETVK